jgi:hypothetical protein
MLNSENKKIVLQNAVSEDMAQAVRQAFLDADYDTIRQERKSLFEREHLTFSPKYPNHDEVYTAEFCRSGYLEKSELVQIAYNEYLRPVVEAHTGFIPNRADLRAYKMVVGGHFRVHKDDWLAKVGFVWYLSKEWKWDWGGLLVDLDIDDDSRAQVTIPTFNQLVIMDHKNDLPHFVTPVTEWAREPRLMLVGFLS